MTPIVQPAAPGATRMAKLTTLRMQAMRSLSEDDVVNCESGVVAPAEQQPQQQQQQQQQHNHHQAHSGAATAMLQQGFQSERVTVVPSLAPLPAAPQLPAQKTLQGARGRPLVANASIVSLASRAEMSAASLPTMSTVGASGPRHSASGPLTRPDGSSSFSPPTSARGDGKISASVVMSDTLLGTGAFGAVYLGIHERSGEMVAVKKVRLGNSSEEARKQVENLVSEIKLMKQLQHPNIVNYLDAERQGDALCIYMEFMAGGTISSLMKKFGRLSPSICRVYMRHALHGVAYLHQRNIVHRDIKPDNILLSASGEAKLSDFGTSREFNDSANLLTVTGTPWFMAPEVVKGSGHGAPADMWSMGCTMIQLLSGQAPMEEFANPVTAMYQIATHPEKVLDLIPKDLPPDCADAVRVCLAEDPMQRATAAQLLQHPYFLEGLASTAAPTASSSAAAGAPVNAAGGAAAPAHPQVPMLNMRPVLSRNGAPVVRAGAAVPAVRALPGAGEVQPSRDAGSRPGTPVGTPRSYASRLREQTQHEQ